MLLAFTLTVSGLWIERNLSDGEQRSDLADSADYRAAPARVMDGVDRVAMATPAPVAVEPAGVEGTDGAEPLLPARPRLETVALTFYVCSGSPAGYQDGYCGVMAGGATVYEGAAACGSGFDLGQRFSIVGDPTERVYKCEDRGRGPLMWIDVFWWDYDAGRAWRNQFAQSVELEVLP